MPSRRAKFPGPVAVFSDELLLATLDNLNGELGNFQPGVPFASPYTSPHVGQPWLLSIEALSGFEYIPFANDHGPLNINVVWKVCRLLATLLRVSGLRIAARSTLTNLCEGSIHPRPPNLSILLERSVRSEQHGMCGRLLCGQSPSKSVPPLALTPITPLSC